MAEVTGTISNEHVELNNAATEATLRLLYQATLNASKQSHDNVAKMVQKAGLDPVAVKAADEGLKKVSSSGADAAANFKKLNPLIGQLLSGTATASSAFESFKDLPGTLGTVISVFSKVAEYQEANMKVYQQISQVGANFSGSLTDMRQAALNSYMSLTEFGGFIRKNGESLSKMGGSANEGAIAFSKTSKVLMGEFGTNLMAMGYTAESVNQGMADYIAMTGGRTREEMKDQKSLAKGTNDYLEQLDRLADITGKSRDEIAKDLKQKQDTADMELYKASLSVKEREEFTKVYNDAKTKYGQGAADNVLAAAQGRAVTTEAGKKYAALAPMATDSLKQQLDATKKYGADSKQARDAENNARINNSKEFMKFSGVLGSASDVLKGNEQAASQAAKDRTTGMDNLTALEKAEAERKKRQADLENSQAAQMAKTEKALKEIGQSINSLLAPAISYVTKIISALAQGLAGIINWFTQLSLTSKLLVAGIAALVLWKTKELIAEKAKETVSGAKGALGGIKGLAPGGSMETALWVKIVPGFGGKGGVPGVPEVPTESGGSKGGKGGKGGKMGKFGKLGGLGGLAGGLALDYAGDKLTESGHDQLGAGAGALSAAVTGASMGAMLGPLGAIAGGLAGGAYGLYQNWDAMTGKTPPKMALGGIVNKPTMVQAGEAGPEVISPLKNFESLQTELQTLNKVSADILKYLKETAENTKRTVDATKSLNGDLFSF